MPANVESMTFHGQTPWHGLGERLADEELYNVEIGIQKAGLDWDVALEPLQIVSDGRVINHYATVRSTDRSILGVVGPKYVPLQNRDAFNWFNPFLESKVARLHTAGSLNHGRVVWVLAHVSGSASEVVKNDRVDQFILLSHGHDGTQAVRVGFTPIRVVCANTLAMAHSKSNVANQLIRVRHTRSVHDNLEAIRDVMDAARAEFAATLEQYRKLAHIHINQADVKKFVRLIFNVKDELPADEIPTRTRNLMDAVAELAEVGTGANIPGVRGTAWGLYNAATEFLSYGRSKDQEKRLTSLWFGSGVDFNRRALEAAMSLAS